MNLFNTRSEYTITDTTLGDYFIETKPYTGKLPPNYISPYLSNSHDQGKCGSCWAYAVTSMLNDRFNRYMKSTIMKLSPIPLLLCDWNSLRDTEKRVAEPRDVLTRYISEYACFGNTLLSALRYSYVFGTTLDTCVGFQLRALDKPVADLYGVSDPPFCSSVMSDFEDMCIDYSIQDNGQIYGTPARRYRASSIYAFPPNMPISNIQYDIYRNGPIVSTMATYDDFIQHDPKTDPPYGTNPSSGSYRGDHAIEIIGWTETSWIVRNSRGSNWGIDGGIFYCLKGRNINGIESNMITCGIDVFEKHEPNIMYQKPFKGSERELLYDTKYSSFYNSIDVATGYSRRVIQMYSYLITRDPVYDRVKSVYNRFFNSW